MESLSRMCSMLCASWMLVSLYFTDRLTEAGHCWLNVNSLGNCERIILSGVDRDACCSSNHGSPDRAWSEADLDSATLFYQQALAQGTPNCQRCSTSCDQVRCPLNKVCAMRSGVPRCVCKGCNLAEYEYTGPVCGTDDRSYTSICNLNTHNCRKNGYVQVHYNGRCQRSCDNVRCPNGLYCMVDQNNDPHCIMCMIDCPDVGPHARLCGADGVTYPSQCHIRAEMCLRGKSIPIAYKGNCRPSATCENTRCLTGQTCLTDPKTKRPQCSFCNGQTYCHPHMEAKTICGTDGKTYSSWCHLKRASCRQRIAIETHHGGACSGDAISDDREYVGAADYQT